MHESAGEISARNFTRQSSGCRVARFTELRCRGLGVYRDWSVQGFSEFTVSGDKTLKLWF